MDSPFLLPPLLFSLDSLQPQYMYGCRPADLLVWYELVLNDHLLRTGLAMHALIPPPVHCGPCPSGPMEEARDGG